ncbi:MULTISPECIES: OmpA family protein [Mesorhizobium]|uniref:Flagellar motor protein MotB n=1 Tax=Rhizobium loti TaxID=381 RepID=A0A6M7TY75_RHILI|nr:MULTISPECIES: OmpA family protein [Mesorhizobium]KRB18487.1 flagellar motor protein MotB [Mesorhizobium sp. Root172]OBQ61012.1 flagellar motor protein MotB [Mesorhizobium loti]QKC69905.1 flagellar motor protein MotB [Mesorhizobium loti]QKC92854.1 flagellar motor protein MotB [Mesorhizobium sp. NZP2234]
MKRQPRILAGTALGLLMASAPLGAFPLQGNAAFDTMQRGGTPLILAQDAPADEGQQSDQEQRRKKKRDQQQTEQAPAEKAAPAAEQAAPATEEQQPRRKKRDQQQQTEQAPAEQAAPAAEEQQPRRKKRDQQQQTEQAPAEQTAPAAEEQQPRRKKRDQQQTEQAPAEQTAPAAQEQQPRKKKRDQQQQTEQAPAEQTAPAAQEQQPRKKKRDQQQQTEQAPAEQAPAGQTEPANDNQQTKPGRKHKPDQQKEAPAAPAVTPEAAPTPKQAPAGEATTPKAETAPAGEQPATQGEQPQDKTKKHGKKPTGEQPANGEQPVTGAQPATGEQPANGGKTAPVQGENPVQGEAPADKNAAPLLDSQKDAERKGGGRRQGDKNGQQSGEQQNGGQNAQQGGDQGRKPAVAPVDQGPPPTDDKAAQQEIKPEKFVPVTEEKGKRRDRAPDENIRDRRRPQGVDVLKEIGDRVIIQLGGQTIVQSNEGRRMNRGARDVYYEDLPQGRTRETVERDNGIRIVTIRNRYGDVIQRSRITPDGREYVLSYVDERDYQDEGDWRDPGDDLPPMRLTIPRRDYILDSEDVQSPDDYYTFLEQPPVERVQRLYSIDEVKRSARVRDIARRVDLDTLNFEFGSSSISDTEVQKLEGVANAMEKLLKKNPAETFLIEGHTDAVGTPEANLALSDRRAEAVAEALTNAFGIPPENLTTQGYGEEYLKVNTSAPNRENRRVAIRRITSLVAPVASNN